MIIGLLLLELQQTMLLVLIRLKKYVHFHDVHMYHLFMAGIESQWFIVVRLLGGGVEAHLTARVRAE